MRYTALLFDGIPLLSDDGLILPPDPFKLVGGDEMDEELGGGFQSNLVHIRLQQRTGRKTLTTVQGLADVFDKKKVDAVPGHILRRQSVVSMPTIASNLDTKARKKGASQLL
jgi:hypothetical protein